MKPILLMDVDGPIAEWKQAFIDRLNLTNGTTYTLEDTGYAWAVEEDLGLSPEVAKPVYDYMDGPGIAASLPETPGAVQALNVLKESYDVVFLTSENKESVDWVYGRRQWLRERFGVLADLSMISAHRKWQVYGDILVDDKLDHLVKWQNFWASKLGSKPPAFRFTSGKDLTNTTPYGITAVKDWSELSLHLTSFVRRV